MENLKNLMGEAYKEGLTIEEINDFLQDKNYVDLKSGLYVNKDKYQKAVDKYNDALNQLKDYNEIKPKYEEFIQKEKQLQLQELAKGCDIKEEFIEFALMKVGDVENVEEALKEFAKNNPQFTAKGVKKVNINPNLENGKVKTNPNETMNDLIRKGAGR